MSLSRYEEIFMRLIAADIVRVDPDEEEPWGASQAVDNIRHYSRLATDIEEHFKERSLKMLEILS